MASESIQTPTLYWVVAGGKGMEIWGYDNEGALDAWSPSHIPDVKVKVHPLHWDFEIDGHDGSGRVRVGSGCQYNPLQMIEAMFQHLTEREPKQATTVIEIDMDMLKDAEVEWNGTRVWGDGFTSDWE